MSVTLVISFHSSKKFFELLNVVPDPWNVIIYNKSPDTNFSLNNSNIKIVNLPNIGRETDTYLNHIILNYNSISDFTIFIQDDTHNHIQDYPGFISFVNEHVNNNLFFQMYPAKYRAGSTSVQKRTFINGCHKASICLPKNAVALSANSLNLHIPNKYDTFVCAHFICSKKSITNHPLSFYQQLLNWHYTDDAIDRNVKGFLFEHMWQMLFCS